MKKTVILLSLIFIAALSGCRNYQLTTQSLLEQLANKQPEKKTNLFAGFPFYYSGMVNGNSLRELVVQDKKGGTHILLVTNHTGIRIIKKDGKKKRFYFDTLLIQDSTITGKHDHYAGINVTPIPLKDIERIEIKN